jgi:serine protease Do
MVKLLTNLLIFVGRTLFLCAFIYLGLSLMQPNPDEYLPVQSRGSSLRQLKRMIEGRGSTPANEIGKNNQMVHEAFEPIVEIANRSTVEVICSGESTALGTAISSDRVISKASELSGRIQCRIRGQGKVNAQIIATDPSCDLALLEVPGANLTPVTFENVEAPPIGTWVVTPGSRRNAPLSVGIVSAKQRLIERDRALLGIFMESSPDGPRVEEVMDGSAAERIGLRRNDVITHLADVAILSRQQLIDGIKTYTPGEMVKLKVLRDGKSLALTAPLSRMDDVMAAEQGFDDHLGGPLSLRRSGFSEIIQHDCILPAHQCGGPIFNVDGQIIGINIARSGRVSTYALPASLVQRKIAELGWRTLSFANSQ